MDAETIDALEELFYPFKHKASMIKSPMIGQLLTDELVQSWKIDDETWWENLYVSVSDQVKENLSCTVVAAVDVIKARSQIMADESSTSQKTHHGGIIGDKLSAQHIYNRMFVDELPGTGDDVFQTLMNYGTTTRGEYNLRKLYTVARPEKIGWFSAEGGDVNILGSTYHTIKNYAAIDNYGKQSVEELREHLNEGPFFGSFEMQKSTLVHLQKQNCLFRHLEGEDMMETNHAVMVYGFGRCSLVNQPHIKDSYWVARNSWGIEHPLIIRGSVRCLQTGFVPLLS